jgi:hypothetical protein
VLADGDEPVTPEPTGSLPFAPPSLPDLRLGSWTGQAQQQQQQQHRRG